MAVLPCGLAAGLTVLGVMCSTAAASTNDTDPAGVLEPEGTPVTLVAFDDIGRCAVSSRGSLYCWVEGAEPRLIRGGSHPRQVIVRYNSVCFLSSRGALGCSGPVAALRGLVGSEKERTGEALNDTSWLADEVRDFDFAGEGSTAHLCAIKKGSTVVCIGNNAEGQLGDATTSFRATPVQVLVAPSRPLRDVQSLHLTDARSCAVTTQGKLYCWGGNHPLDQARAYHGPKRYLLATEVPLGFSVARMGERCLISQTREQYCWGVVDRQTEKVAITPIARARCGLSLETSGSYCSLSRERVLVCGDGEDRLVRRLSPTERVEDYLMQTCIGSGSEVTCFTDWQLHLDPTSFGFQKPEQDPFHRCRGEPPREDPPRFPPHRYHHVEVTGRGFPTGPVRLSPSEVEVLNDIASSTSTFTDRTTCHDPSLQFHYVDDSGEVVAAFSGEGCPTLAIWPGSTAVLFQEGNIVTPETRMRFTELIRSLRASARRTKR